MFVKISSIQMFSLGHKFISVLSSSHFDRVGVREEFFSSTTTQLLSKGRSKVG